MSGLSEKTTKNEYKEQQEFITEEQKLTEHKDALPAPEPAEKVKIVGRDTLGESIPREAYEKNLTGAVKGFFGLNKNKQPAAGGDENDVNVHQSANAHPVQAEPVHAPAIDLSAEERISASERARADSWNDLAVKVSEIINSDEYQNASDESKLYFDRIMGSIRADVTEEVRVATEAEVFKSLYEIAERIKRIDLFDGPDEAVVAADKARALAKIKDRGILMKLYSLLEQKTGGGLALTGDEKIQDFNDDSFPDREFKIKRTRIGTDGSILDTVNIRMQKENDRSGEPLFATEPAISDIKQGYLGDCYFLSALNAVMFKDPQLIKNSMKDEGETVVVRFFAMSTGKPVYVRVRKTVPVHKFKGKNRQGNDVTSVEEIYGNKGPLWVNMMEKAFAAARHQLDIYCESGEFRRNHKKNEKGYGVLDFGLASNAIRILTGTQMEMKLLPGLQGRKKYTDISALFSQVHYAEKDDFMRGRRADGSKRTASDWNRYKAEKIFGIRIGEGDGRLLNIFRKNRVFDAYQRFLNDHLKRNFNSLGNKEAKPGFSTMTDLNLFIESIDISQMPTLNLGDGIDEAQVKRHYLEYFRSTVAASGLLSNGINTNGEYSEEEKNIFRDIKKNLVTNDMKKRAVTASTARHGLSFKSGSALVGGSGEMLVDGVADSHVYSILGTRTRDVTVNGKTVKLHFVILHNPWNDSKVRLYEHDTMKPYMAAEGTDAKGTFLMELSDFCNTFQEYTVEKDGAYKDKQRTRLAGDELPEYTPVTDLTDEERNTQSVKDSRRHSSEVRELLEGIRKSKEYAGYSKLTRALVDDYHKLVSDNTKAEQRDELGLKIRNTLIEVQTAMRDLQNIGDLNMRENTYRELRNKYGEPDILFMLAGVMLPLAAGELELTGQEQVIDATKDEKYYQIDAAKKSKLLIQGKETDPVSEKTVTDDPICDRKDYPLFTAEPNADDILQGDIGDCYLIAGLKAVVEKNPGLIRRSVKDEGKTVVFRFYEYASHNPVYVRINKSVAYKKISYIDGEGQTQVIETRRGCKGALWVCLIEKAYAYARRFLHDPLDSDKKGSGMDRLEGGKAQYFLQTFIGKNYKETRLPGNEHNKDEYVNFDFLAENIKETDKDSFMKERNEDGSKRTARDWNFFKAKKMFGIDIPQGNTRLYDLFRKNTILDKYNAFMGEYLKKNFMSDFSENKLEPGLVSTNDLDLFLDSIDLNEMPVIGLDSGIDEMRLRKNYIEYFRKAAKELNVLRNSVCTDGKYSDRENNIYRELEAATGANKGKKKMVVTGVKKTTLMKRKKDQKDTGANGESKILGVAAKHAYMINGVIEKDVTFGGRTIRQRFVEIHNPWHSNYIRLYDKDTMRPFRRKNNIRNDGTEYENKGTFLMELRDFAEMFESYSIV